MRVEKATVTVTVGEVTKTTEIEVGLLTREEMMQRTRDMVNPSKFESVERRDLKIHAVDEGCAVDFILGTVRQQAGISEPE